MRDDDFELRLSMKAILMYEKLTGKSFSLMQDEESVKIFMYCVFVCSTDLKITYPVFCNMLEVKKFAANIEKQFKRLWGFEEQFPRAQREENPNSAGTAGDISMTDYINTLVFDYQISIDYAMNRMELWELEALYNAATAHMQATMEDKRLWAYIQMLPNFDKKHKNMTPDKFLPFPWEADSHKKKIEKDLEIETEKSKGIIGMNINDLLSKKEDKQWQENLQ